MNQLNVLLLIILVSFLLGFRANDFALVPEENPVHVGGVAEFSCLGPSGSTNQQWLINGTQFEALNLTDVTVMFGDRTVLFSNTPLVFNGTTVQCILLAASGEELSSTVGVLLVQGLLDAVSDVNVEYNSQSFIISWTAPFTYQVPFVDPLISYCIFITNVSSSSILVNQTCELLNTNYSVELEYDPCVEYSATIIAVNPVGDGEPAVIHFPAPSVVTSDDVTARAEAGETVYEGSLTNPVCTCSVTLLVGGAAGTTTNCMADTNSTIKFRVMDLNQQFNAIVTLTNARLDTSSEITLSSYDVQSIAVDSPAPNAVTLTASYLENSPAMGVVFALLFTDDAGSVNFTKSLYLVLDNVESSGFIQNDVTRGEYNVVAFDLEEDGRPWSTPAVQQGVVVNGEDLSPFPYPPVSQVHNCATDIVDTDLTVSCDFNDGSVLGYYVLVQFAEDLMLLTGETQDGSPVVFEDLPANGVYNVVVFPLTENGIVGTTVAFTEQVSLAPATSPTDGGLGTGAIAAIIVVLLVVITPVLLIFIIMCYLLYNRRKTKSTTPESTPQPEYEQVLESGGIELETNVCYQQNIRPKLDEAYEPVEFNEPYEPVDFTD